MRILVCLLLAGALLMAGAAMAQRQHTMKAVASTTRIMQAMTIPASNALFNVPRQPPENDEEWAAVANHAIILAGSGNLLMIGDRARDQGDWMEMSQAMVDAGAVAMEAAQAKNVDALVGAGNPIIESCQTCHQSYWEQSGQNE